MDSIWYGVFSIIAILVGPFLGILAQKKIEQSREEKNRQEGIFKTLMSTRRAGLSPEHVRALNMIELEFRNESDVLKAWKEYHDVLGDSTIQFEQWITKKDDLLISLLRVMGAQLGYDFDNVDLKRGGYHPSGYMDVENELAQIRKELVKILTDQKPLHVATVAPSKELESAHNLMMGQMGAILFGKQPISVKLVDESKENT